MGFNTARKSDIDSRVREVMYVAPSYMHEVNVCSRQLLDELKADSVGFNKLCCSIDYGLRSLAR